MAAVAAAIDRRMEVRRHRLSGPLRDGSEPAGPRVVTIGGTAFAFEADATADGVRVRFADGRSIPVASTWRPGEPVWQGRVDGEPLSVQVRMHDGRLVLSQGGATADLRVMSVREAELAALMRPKVAAASGRHLLCPMPGVVREVLVAEGQEVKLGEPLVVIEAMKMENVLRAERDGRLARIHVAVGDSLAVDAAILDFAT